MASSSTANFRKCVHPCQRFLTPDDMHVMCVMCMGEEHARSVLEGAVCMHCDRFSLRKLRSRLSLFSRESGQPSLPRGSGPAAAEASRRLQSWGSQVELADKFEKGMSISHFSSAAGESELRDDDVLSLMSSDPAVSALLASSQDEQEEAVEIDDVSEHSQPACPTYDELLDVMSHATEKLDLPWKREPPRGRLDECFLSGHNRSACTSLPFLPDLHTEVRRAWGKPYSARIHYSQANYADVEGMQEYGYASMPSIEDRHWLAISRLVRYPHWSRRLCRLSHCVLHHGWTAEHMRQRVRLGWHCTQWPCCKPTRLTCWRTWTRAGDFPRRQWRSCAVPQIWILVPLSKQPPLVATERHLWLNLEYFREKEKNFLLDASVSPSKLFGTSVETVIGKFLEAKARFAAFKTFMPRRSRSKPQATKGAGSSQSEDRRQDQKASTASRAPPPSRGRARRRRKARGRRKDLREVIQSNHSERSRIPEAN